MKSNRLKRMEKWHEDNATEKSDRLPDEIRVELPVDNINATL